MNNGQLYISDLDGTLLRNDATLSDYSRETLTRLLDSGIKFTVASARSYHSIKPLLQNLALKLPVVEFNGAFITDYNSGHHLKINQINPAIVDEVFRLLIKKNLQPLVSSFNGVDDKLYYQEITNEGMNWYINDRVRIGDKRLTRIKRFTLSASEQIVCINIIGRYDQLTATRIELGEHINGSTAIQLLENPYNPGWFWLTIHAPEASKDIAITQILEMYGYNRGQLTVFGDNTNDIGMFKLAGKSLAVSNACDELKEFATEIIDDNQSDAVAKYLDSIS